MLRYFVFFHYSAQYEFRTEVGVTNAIVETMVPIYEMLDEVSANLASGLAETKQVYAKVEAVISNWIELPQTNATPSVTNNQEAV